jgi:hypothetical protein
LVRGEVHRARTKQGMYRTRGTVSGLIVREPGVDHDIPARFVSPHR